MPDSMNYEDLQAQGESFKNLDDGRTYAENNRPIASANAYLGHAPKLGTAAAG